MPRFFPPPPPPSHFSVVIFFCTLQKENFFFLFFLVSSNSTCRVENLFFCQLGSVSIRFFPRFFFVASIRFKIIYVSNSCFIFHAPLYPFFSSRRHRMRFRSEIRFVLFFTKDPLDAGYFFFFAAENSCWYPSHTLPLHTKRVIMLSRFFYFYCFCMREEARVRLFLWAMSYE